MKSKVFKTAHQIKQYFTTWSEALKAAWAVVKLFFGRPINLTFAKSCGEVREAKAVKVYSLDTIKKGFIRFVEALESGETQFRSFRLERLIFS